MRFAYTDGEKLCVFSDGKTEKYESAYLAKYRENSTRAERNREWKKNSDMMIDEGYYYSSQKNAAVHAAIHSVCLTLEENKIAYAFSVNETSGVYFKYLDDKEKTEAHLISSNEVDFNSYVINGDGDALGVIRTGAETSDIAVFDRGSGDYKTLTGGDSLDENPFLDDDGNVLFNSYGIGRDQDNDFITYLPSEILRLNTQSMQLETVVSDGKYSFVKPMTDGQGNLYCIRKPGAQKKRTNFLLEILLIPVRIVQAIVGFVSLFVTIFAGKPMVSDGGRSNGKNTAAKNGGARKGAVFINNQLVNVDEELKRNKKTEDGGFIPRKWTLVRMQPKNGEHSDENADFGFDTENGVQYEVAEEIAFGVADYALTEDNVLICTNGKRIFECRLQDGKWNKKKLVNTDFCLKVSAISRKVKQSSPFEEEQLFTRF